MKKILFIITLGVSLFSCDKAKINSPLSSDYCPEMYEQRSSLLNMDIYNDVSYYYSGVSGCMGFEPLVSHGLYSFYKINPANPYEIVYLVENSNNNLFSLKKYNFCSNNSTTIKDNMINYCFDISTKGWVLFALGPGQHLYKMKENGDSLMELPHFPTFTNSNESPIWNPAGDFFISHAGELYDEDGIPVDTIEFNNANLIGWLNNTSILTSKESKTFTIDIGTGNSEIYLTNNHDYYDCNSLSFFKRIDSSGYQKWNIYDNYGSLKASTQFHYKQSAWFGGLSSPALVDENKIISGLMTQEYYPDNSSFSCQLLEKHSIVIIDLDDANVRKVDFPD